MEKTAEVAGKKVIVPDFECKDCGHTELKLSYLPSNNSIKAVCAKCERYFKFLKYDSRPREVIRKEMIEKWKQEQSEKQEKS